jgi:hypothetical protein
MVPLVASRLKVAGSQSRGQDLVATKAQLTQFPCFLVNQPLLDSGTVLDQLNGRYALVSAYMLLYPCLNCANVHDALLSGDTAH